MLFKDQILFVGDNFNSYLEFLNKIQNKKFILSQYLERKPMKSEICTILFLNRKEVKNSESCVHQIIFVSDYIVSDLTGKLSPMICNEKRILEKLLEGQKQ